MDNQVDGLPYDTNQLMAIQKASPDEGSYNEPAN
jgi:hypothetical protein